MKNKFVIDVFNEQRFFENKIRLLDLIPVEDHKKYFCAKVNNRIRELTYEVYDDAKVEFLSIENEEAMYIYENTLRYLITMALYEINPNLNLKLSYYESRSIYCILLNDHIEINDKFIQSINDKMTEIVKADYPLVRKIVPIEEAKKIYTEFNMQDKIDLLKYRPEKTVHFYVCNNY